MEFVLELSPAALVFWGLTGLWLTELRLGSGYRGGWSRRGRIELGVILAAMVAAYALNAAAHAGGARVVDGGAGAAVRWSGLGLYGCGVVLRLWAARSLGEWFTRDVRVEDDQELVSSGPYRWLRHPLYVALVLVTLGLGLLFRTPIESALGAVIVVAALLPRVRREQRLLERRFGEALRRG